MNTLYLDLSKETNNDKLQGNCFNYEIKWSEFWKYPINTYINIDNIDLKDKYIKITDSGITTKSCVDIGWYEYFTNTPGIYNDLCGDK